MKKILVLASIVVTLAGCISSATRIQNPLDIKFGDPYVMLASDGHYYMYGTGGVRNGFGCYRSDDLQNWEYLGAVYKGNTEDSWAESCFWAPEVYERDGKEMFCVYHGRTASTGDARVVFIDRMSIHNGKLSVDGPTTAEKIQP